MWAIKVAFHMITLKYNAIVAECGHQINFKDVRAQNVPTFRLFLNLPCRKVMIYLCQKGKKKGGSPCSFSRS